MKDQCGSCSIGKLMGHGAGGYCPFLEESLAPGSVIFDLGSEAIYSWYLKEGTVCLLHQDSSVQVVRGPSDVLGPALVEQGRRTARAIAITEVSLCRGANAVLPSQHGESP